MRGRVRQGLAVAVGGAVLAASLVAATGPVASAAACSVTNPATGVRFGSVQSAVTAAAPGATLRISGTCSGAVTIGKRLTLVGTGTGPTLRGGGNRPVAITAGPVTIDRLRITGGVATTCPGLSDACGGGILAGARLVLKRSVVEGNIVSGSLASGGGIAVLPGASAKIIDSTIRDNTVSAENDAGIGRGGGIATEGPLTLIRTLVDGNDANGFNAFGGGIGAHASNGAGTASVGLTDSVVVGNKAVGVNQGEGGGIDSDDTVRLTRTTVAANQAVGTSTGVSTGAGGGVFAVTAAIANSTISGNTAQGLGVAVGGSAAGGVRVGDGSIIATTISGNAANQGGGLFLVGAAEVGSTIVAGNTSTLGADCVALIGATSVGRNLIGIGDGCNGVFVDGVLGDKVGSAASPLIAKLAPLADNGGLTPTRALKTGSPAINGAGATPCSTTTDQRGVKRPQGAKCDIGAFEKQP